MERKVQMTITQRLMQLDPSLALHNEGEWSGTTLKYSAFNDGGVECEVGEFLYGLIKLIKPTRVLETGTHHGVGGAYLGLALQDNGMGVLDTLEYLDPNYDIANERFVRLGLKNQVNNMRGDVALFTPPHSYQLILLDTEPQTRFAELVKFYPYLDEGGFVFIHDLHRHMHQIRTDGHEFAWPYGKIPQGIIDLVREGKLRPFHFSTPRGLTGFYKVSREDYNWE